MLNGRAVDEATVLSAEALAGQKPSAAAVLKYSATDGDLQGSAASQLPAARQRPLARRCQHHRGPHIRPDPQQCLQHARHGQPGALWQQGPDPGPGQPRPPGGTGSHALIVLAGLAPGEAQLSVHVRSAGGPVAAAIQQSVLRGLTPGGVDFIAPGAAPAARQVMTGMDIQDAGGIAAVTGKAATTTPARPCSSPSRVLRTPWWRSSSSAGTARRHCPTAAWSPPRPAP